MRFKMKDGVPASEMRLAAQLAAAAAKAKPEKLVTNEEFVAMTPAEKRVTIAKDVLKWIAIRKLQPRKGTYLQVRAAATLPDDGDPDRKTESWRPEALPAIKDLENVDTVNGDACYACALGGVFALSVERCDFAVKKSLDTPHGIASGIRDLLNGIFEPGQLTLIECAFERSHRFGYQDGDEVLTYDDRVNAGRFGQLIHDQVYGYGKITDEWDTGVSADIDRRVMRAIMQNIIDNDGTFVP